MDKKLSYINPNLMAILSTMGKQIKMARKRRKLTMELVCARASIARATLAAIEKGSPSVSMGCYAKVLHALNGLDGDLLLLAKDDSFGRAMVDARLLKERNAR